MGSSATFWAIRMHLLPNLGNCNNISRLLISLGWTLDTNLLSLGNYLLIGLHDTHIITHDKYDISLCNETTSAKDYCCPKHDELYCVMATQINMGCLYVCA